MALETELQRLVVRLIGDASSYQDMLTMANRQTQTIMGNIATAGTLLNNYVVAPLKAVGAASIYAFATFDQAMTESTSIMEVTKAEMKDMRDQALMLSEGTTKGPDEIAKGFYHLASAGFDAQQSMAAMPTMINFAVAGAFNLEKAVALASAGLNSLGLASKDPIENMQNLAQVTDVLAKAANIAQGNVEEYALALSRDAGATMKQFNVELEQGVAVLAAYGQQNIKGAFAGNMYGRALRLLAFTANKNADAHKELGFEVFDSQGNMRNMADIAENLENIFRGMSPQVRAAALEMLGFKALSQKAILPLVGQSQAIREFEAQMTKAKGTVSEMSERQMQSFMNQMAMLSNRIRVVAINIGGILAPAFTVVGDVIKSILGWWDELGAATQKAVVQIGLFAAVVASLPFLGLGIAFMARQFGAILFAIVSIMPGLGTMTSLLVFSSRALIGLFFYIFALLNPIRLIIELAKGLFLIFSIYTSPVVLVVRLLVTVGAVMFVLVERAGGLAKAWEDVKTAVVEFWDYIMPIRQALALLFTTVVTTGIDAFRKLGEQMLYWWNYATGDMEVDWADIKESIVDGILMMVFGIQEFGDVSQYAFTSAQYELVKYGNAMEYFAFDVIPAALEWFQNNWEFVVLDIYDWATEKFDDLVSYINNAILDFDWAGSWQGFKEGLWKGFTMTRSGTGGLIPMDIIGLGAGYSWKDLFGGFGSKQVLEKAGEVNKDLGTKFEEINNGIKPFTLPKPQLTPFQDELAQSLEDQWDKLTQKWNSFKDTTKEQFNYDATHTPFEKLRDSLNKISPGIVPIDIPLLPITPGPGLVEDSLKGFNNVLGGGFAFPTEEMAIQNAAKAKKAGEGTGNMFKKGFKENTHKLDAALAFSVEGLSRIAEQADRFGTNFAKDRKEELLVEIRDELRKQNDTDKGNNPEIGALDLGESASW